MPTLLMFVAAMAALFFAAATATALAMARFKPQLVPNGICRLGAALFEAIGWTTPATVFREAEIISGGMTNEAGQHARIVGEDDPLIARAVAEHPKIMGDGITTGGVDLGGQHAKLVGPDVGQHQTVHRLRNLVSAMICTFREATARAHQFLRDAAHDTRHLAKIVGEGLTNAWNDPLGALNALRKWIIGPPVVSAHLRRDPSTTAWPPPRVITDGGGYVSAHLRCNDASCGGSAKPEQGDWDWELTSGRAAA